ncbi:hypothetical protein JB92DRAFT_2914017 [Gautieria morchelliformis]|nr:hypothetical protein JB92DRAFT_2914017 [Gautieria morchelliformis]
MHSYIRTQYGIIISSHRSDVFKQLNMATTHSPHKSHCPRYNSRLIINDSSCFTMELDFLDPMRATVGATHTTPCISLDYLRILLTDTHPLTDGGIAASNAPTEAIAPALTIHSPLNTTVNSMVPPQASALPPSESPQHTFSQVGTLTSLSDLEIYIIKTNDEGNTYHRCAYPTCSDKARFPSRRHVISHIRRVHLKEKPFICSCGKMYAYAQDAKRHVDTKNQGKIHECCICNERYARQDYRDLHEKRCVLKERDSNSACAISS